MKISRKQITVSFLKTILQYHNGKIFWLKKISNKVNIGQKAGCYSGKYGLIKINKKTYQIHRIVWALNKGYWPLVIDHINFNTWDNRLTNLREVTYSQNNRHRRKFKKAYSKYKGVTWDLRHNKWVAKGSIDGKTKFLGYFNNEIKAALKFDEFTLKYFDHHATINFGERKK